MRTIIDLTDEQLTQLALLCREEGISRASAVRLAVDQLLERRRSEANKARTQRGFGAWGPPDFDSRELVDQLREEWDERERRLGL